LFDKSYVKQKSLELVESDLIPGGNQGAKTIPYGADSLSRRLEEELARVAARRRKGLSRPKRPRIEAQIRALMIAAPHG